MYDVVVFVFCVPGTGDENVLNQVGVPIISREVCSRPDWYGGGVTAAMICAGFAEGRKDSCQVSKQARHRQIHILFTISTCKSMHKHKLNYDWFVCLLFFYARSTVLFINCYFS